jgi:hypothetical protein
MFESGHVTKQFKLNPQAEFIWYKCSWEEDCLAV